MKEKLVFSILMFSSFLFAQKTEMLHKEKIDSIIQKLNEWDVVELDLYERLEAYSPKLITSGETNRWIIVHKEKLKELGAEVIWNEK